MGGMKRSIASFCRMHQLQGDSEQGQRAHCFLITIGNVNHEFTTATFMAGKESTGHTLAFLVLEYAAGFLPVARSGQVFLSLFILFSIYTGVI